MFTGLPPTTHRAGAQGMSWRLRGGLTTLPELFRERGYLTAAFTEGIALNGSLGFFQGFEQYSNGEPLGEDPAAGSAGKTFDRAKRWLDDFGASPFFLFLHTYEIHAPYGAPAGHRGRFSKRYSERVTPDKGIGSKAERDRVVALYDEGIAYTDHVFGELMVYLKERDLYENSIIVVFSDHGEEFWEHGAVAHGRTLYQEVLHVPLLIKESGHPAGGARISTRVSLSDAFATLNEMAAIEQIAPPESSSLVPLMRGDASKYTRSLVRSELFQNDRRHFYVSAVRGSWKYIIRARFEDLDAFRIDGGSSPSARWSGARELDFLQSRAEEIAAPAGGPDSAASARVREWLFDLRADPGETRSLARSSVDELQILRSEIVKAMQASTEFARTRLAPGARAEPLSEAERANLEALGYL